MSPLSHNYLMLLATGTGWASCPFLMQHLPSLPPIIVKFRNLLHRSAILRNKKAIIPASTAAEKLAGAARFIIVEDLTPSNHKLLRDLQEDERVSKVWSVDGRIRFVLEG